MAGKFKIFCDNGSTREDQVHEREKGLALGSNPSDQSTQLQHQQQTAKFKIFCDNGSTTTTTSATTKEDQANEQEKFIALHSVTSTEQHHHHHQQQQQWQQPAHQGGAPQSQQQRPLAQKREPLGLRQPLQTTSAAAVEAASAPCSSSAATTSSSVLSEEDQENDISMASLGSDFIPSILHDNDFDDNEHSFEVEEDEYECDEADLRGFTPDDEDEYDYEDDEELQMELSQAFKQHDDSQLFKSTVFIDDIQSYLEDLERDPELRPLPNYMDFQKDIDSDKRAILINWLVEVSDEYQLQTETLFICTSIIDRFLSKMSIPTSNFQLLGVAAMFIASKYEEIYPPNLFQFVEVTDDTYSGQQIRQMEKEILKTLNFRITLPTISFFLRKIFAFNKFPKKVFNLAEYLCYLSLLSDQPILEYYPSEIALAAVILAANQLDSAGNISSDLKSAYDKSNMDQLRRRELPRGVKLRDVERRVYIVDKNLPFCIESLRALQHRAFTRSSKSLIETAVATKFSSESYNRVALLEPPSVEDLFLY